MQAAHQLPCGWAITSPPTLSTGQSPARLAGENMKFSQLLAASCLVVLVSSAPQRRRNQNVNTKFFTGNNAIDSAAWGAALGAGTQYFANQVFSILLANTMLLTNITFIFYFAYQVFNPCRGGNRGGTRGGNKGTNTRFLAPTLRNLYKRSSQIVNIIENQVLPWQQQPRWQRPGRIPRRIWNCRRHSQSPWKSMWLKDCDHHIF